MVYEILRVIACFIHRYLPSFVPHSSLAAYFIVKRHQTPEVDVHGRTG
jgi:hypothetical protein